MTEPVSAGAPGAPSKSNGGGAAGAPGVPPKSNGGGGAGLIRETPLTEALGERYLAYAMSTIVSR